MDANSLSLFANLRLIELKLRNAPDAGAAKNLVKLAAQPPADTVLLVTGELEPKQQKSAWVNEFERQGTVVVAPAMTRERLPEWIARRLQQHGVTLEPEAAQLLADRVEGNLLAAQQEIERIALLQPGATLDADAVAELVADNARLRRVRAVDGGVPRQRVARTAHPRRPAQRRPRAAVDPVGVAQRPARRLARAAARAERPQPRRHLPRRAGLGQPAGADAGSRCSGCAAPTSIALLVAAARADRVAKGSLRGEPWVEITGLVARIAGVQLAAA